MDLFSRCVCDVCVCTGKRYISWSLSSRTTTEYREAESSQSWESLGGRTGAQLKRASAAGLRSVRARSWTCAVIHLGMWVKRPGERVGGLHAEQPLSICCPGSSGGWETALKVCEEESTPQRHLLAKMAFSGWIHSANARIQMRPRKLPAYLGI